ncbi:MAG: glycosyl hydrolase [Herbinix sp.]|jgi:beta-glucosidase|nr:glycosyl hydrolase [Herbinix sp.]
MSNAKFRTIIISSVAILIALMVTVTQTAMVYTASLDWALGRGERHVADVDGAAPENAQFYETEYKTPEESRLAASLVAQEVVEEGAVLLKNQEDVLPLSQGAKVTPFGYHYVSPYYGGAGSANVDTSADYVVTPEEALTKAFEVNNTVAEKMKGATAETMIVDESKEGTNLSEYNADIYQGSEASCADTTGIVFIARPSMEGYDYNSAIPYSDGTETQLELTANEKNTIAYAKENCSNVIVVLSCATPIEIVSLQTDDQIDAILWIGLPGATGFEAMAKILDGEVNPSGKTSALWYADFKSDPTYVNRITTPYINAVEDGPSSYLEYEEGIYVGYRYYETRYAEDNSFPVFGESKGYENAVVYPFGFGLNYEDDKVTQTLDSVEEKDGRVTVKGTVTNASSRDVSEVVQIYYGAPYTKGGIEKSAKELAEFTKVKVKAGDKEEFSIEFSVEDMASYDYQKLYSDQGSYVLEAGDYEIFLGKDSHDVWGSEIVKVDETLVYADTAKSGKAVGKRSTDEVLAQNLFDGMNEYPVENDMTILSRSDFAGTFPAAPVAKAASTQVVKDIQKFDYKTDSELGEVEGSLLYHDEAPVDKADNGIQLSSLRGLTFEDPMWDELLDNLDYSSTDIPELITRGLYMTAAVDAIGKVETSDHDGTVGLTATWGGNTELAEQFGTTTSPVTACSYPCGSVQAATWNRELVEKMGEMVGIESLTNNVNGWYAPGLNLHRTPYSGRTFEYYSEDPVLTGYIASAVVSGAFTEGGLTTYLKHFALNETDENRSTVAVWADEQSSRQLYLKAFELCVKNATGTEKYYDTKAGEVKTIEANACRAIMTSMNYVGAESPTNSYTMLTKLLRDEWGFEGMVLTDFTSGTYKSKDVGYRIGNDLWMGLTAAEIDLSTPTAKWSARNAIHNISYVVVNGNAYNNVMPGAYAYYDMSPWMIKLIAADIIVGVICLLAFVWVIVRQLDERKHPGKYK